MYISSLVPLAILAASCLAADSPPELNTQWFDLMPRVAPGTNSTNATGQSPGPNSPKKWKHFECGTDITHASADFLAKSHELHAKSQRQQVKGGTYNYARKRGEALADLVERQTAAPVSSIAINTYFHVVSSQSEAGSITQAMALAQMQAMNTAYNPYNIHFYLRGTSFTVNDAWAAGASSSDDLAMKNALRQGTYSTLNIYFQTDLAGGVLGKCTLPAQITGYVPPSAYANDGCNIQAQTMPGGDIDDYNLGQTAVHETGHWLGLLHVFEGYSCDSSNTGDMIADTPQQSISTDGCPTSPVQDSCPGVSGVDSIHNIMDYSIDSCYQGFSNGQIQRVMTFWPQYRQGR